MQDILTCAMGLDVHRDIIVACLVKGAVDAEPEAEIRTFSTLIPEMQKLRDWVIEADCRHVAMESTGIYWQPIYEMLTSKFSPNFLSPRPSETLCLFLSAIRSLHCFPLPWQPLHLQNYSFPAINFCWADTLQP